MLSNFKAGGSASEARLRYLAALDGAVEQPTHMVGGFIAGNVIDAMTVLIEQRNAAMAALRQLASKDHYSVVERSIRENGHYD